MTAAELKARELVIKMQYSKPPLMFVKAKQCALIAVDEILKCNPQSDQEYSTLSFWEEVENEIKKL